MSPDSMIATSAEAEVKGRERDALAVADHRARAVLSMRRDRVPEHVRPLNRHERRALRHALRKTK